MILRSRYYVLPLKNNAKLRKFSAEPQKAPLSRKEARRLEASQHERASERAIKGKTGAWEMVIGLEVHAQILSESKLFSDGSTQSLKLPNTQVAEIDVALPGSLPVLNAYCVEQAIRTGLALNGTINPYSRISNYPIFSYVHRYPVEDVTFLDPIVSGGHITLHLPSGEQQEVPLERIQLETDSAKSIHDLHPQNTLIDFNRSGMALMEIITKPEIHTSLEASLFLKKLALILRQINVCVSEVGEGLRCDANVSVRKVGETTLGERCEIKNLNSISALRDAVEYEARRQIALLESGQEVELETRWFDPIKKTTSTARRKADKTDYRFFPEPDLPPLYITKERVASIQASLPELVDESKARLEKDYNISPSHATLISLEEGGTWYFAETVAFGLVEPTMVSQWMINELFSHRETFKGSMKSLLLTPEKFSTILNLQHTGKVTAINAKKVISILCLEGGDPEECIRQNSWEVKPIDMEELERQCNLVLDANPEDVKNYLAADDGQRKRILRNFVGKMKLNGDGKQVSMTMQRLLENK